MYRHILSVTWLKCHRATQKAPHLAPCNSAPNPGVKTTQHDRINKVNNVHTWAGLRPVKENMPSWRRMKDHSLSPFSFTSSLYRSCLTVCARTCRHMSAHASTLLSRAYPCRAIVSRGVPCHHSMLHAHCTPWTRCCILAQQFIKMCRHTVSTCQHTPVTLNFCSCFIPGGNSTCMSSTCMTQQGQ